MDFVKLNGRVYDVLVTDIQENFNILYSDSTGRTMSIGARMTLDPLGTFFGHKITFRRKQGAEADFDALFDTISQPRTDGIPVEIVHNQATISYDAYISSGTRDVTRIDQRNNKVYWDNITVNIIPMEAQVTI